MKRILSGFLIAGIVLSVAGAGIKDFSEEKSDHFVVYFKDIPGDFVANVLEYCERYYEELTEKLGFKRFDYWTWEKRAKVYIYPDKETFEKETKQPGWAGGVASYAEKTIWTFPHESGFFDTLLPHEIGHIVFREVVGSHNNVPLWLEEGVASYLEQAKRIGAEKTALDALMDKTFISYKTLEKIDELTLRTMGDVNLFYAESTCLVNYLIEKYGIEAFNNFCQKLKDGKSLDDALSFAYFYIRSSSDLGDFWEKYLQEKLKNKEAAIL